MTRKCENCKFYLGELQINYSQTGYGYIYNKICSRKDNIIKLCGDGCAFFERIVAPTASWEEARTAMKAGDSAYRVDCRTVFLSEGLIYRYVDNGEYYTLTEDDFDGRWTILKKEEKEQPNNNKEYKYEDDADGFF